MMRQEFDAGFRLSPFGDVLIGADPAAIRQRLMIDRNQPPIAELLQESAFLAPVDEALPRQVDFVDMAARIISDGATVGENVVQRHTRAQPGHWLMIDPAELLVDELKPILGVVQTDALRHVGDGLLETLPERARTCEAPREVITDRGPRLRKSAAAGVRGRLMVPGSTRHVRIPANLRGNGLGASDHERLSAGLKRYKAVRPNYVQQSRKDCPGVDTSAALRVSASNR